MKNLSIIITILLSIICSHTGFAKGNLLLKYLDDQVDSTHSNSTTKASTQNRDSATYNWQVRHQEVLKLNKIRPPKVIFIGNSIIHYWGGEPVAKISRGKNSWDNYFKTKDVRNLGFGFDRIENVLCRVYNGELDGYKAKHILLSIGTNNLSVNTDEEILEGLKLLIKEIRNRQKQAKITFLAILPRRNYETRIEGLNARIKGLIKYRGLKHINSSALFLKKEGKINENLFSDGVHPNEKGYNLLAEFIAKYL